MATLGVACRQLRFPGGEVRKVAYLGDLKLVQECRGGIALRRLARAAEEWITARTDGAFCVVMDGTPVTPVAYSGRAGIPAFRELGKVVVLRLLDGPAPVNIDQFVAAGTQSEACYRNLTHDRCASLGGNLAERSEMTPQWLLHPDGAACGLLEDTRRAKRLFANDGLEMRSAHLSCFAYKTPQAAAELLGAALTMAKRAGQPALFVSVAAMDADAVCRDLAGIDFLPAPATIYGRGIEPPPLWNINTSEI